MTPGRTTSTGRATSSRCATAPAACSSGPAAPRRPCDLSRAAGLSPAGVLCEIVTEDKSEMARLRDLERFAKKHDLPLISIAELIRYRRQNEKLVRLVSEAAHPRAGPRVPRPSSTSRCWTTSSTWRSSWATSPGPRTCWSGSTSSA